MVQSKKITKNIFLVVFSTLLMVLSIFSIIINTKARKFAFDCVRADSTTTNFFGSNVYVPTQSQYYGGSNTWESVDWNLLNTPYSITSGNHVWTDGTNYYYSNSNNQYVLDVSTSTWSTKIWSGLTSFRGNYIWTDGTNYYYSNSNIQYVLDVSTSTWTTKSWNGLSSFTGTNVWTDGTNYYYSNTYNQYVLDVSTSTWTTKSWNGLSSFSGSSVVYFDGNIYYFNVGSNYILDVSTSSWSSYYFDNFNNITGNECFVIDNILYYSHSNISMYWNPYASGGGQPTTQTAQMNFNSVKFKMLDNGNGTFNVYQNSLFFNNFDGVLSYSASDKFVAYNSDISQISTSDFVDYLTFSFNSTSISYDYYIPYHFNGTYYYSKLTINVNTLSNLNMNAITFSGTRTGSVLNDYITIHNTIKYSSASATDFNSNFISFTFDSSPFDENDTIVDYYGDTMPYDDFTAGFGVNTDYHFVFRNRIYYLIADSGVDYQNGLQSGQEIGYQQGYQVGYSAGSEAVSQSQYNAGYSAGYSAGAISANHYSFLGLISAVIDAPIQAFTGLFNFNLLGVNIMDFITSLFTLAVVITIVKKVV